MAVSSTGSSENRNTNSSNSNNTNMNNSNSGNPYVCLSAHCDLLHYVGPVPHPYGGPTPQTIADRASRYIRFSCESLDRTPSVGVKCEHSLFSSVPLERTSDGVPFFPFSGVGLAQWGFRHNFDVSSSDSKLDFKLKNEQEQGGVNEDFIHSKESHNKSDKTPNPSVNEAKSSLQVSSEVNPAAVVVNGIYDAINPFALRRMILQALCVLNLPKRSPAVAFTFCAHDTTPFGATIFLILPRSAEQMPALAHPVKVSLVVTRVNNSDVLMCSFPSSDLQNTRKGKNDIDDNNMSSLPCTLSPFFIKWELKEDTVEKSQTVAGTVDLGSFLSKTMIIKLFSAPASRFSEGTENKDECTRRVVSWAQRRSFHFLALIAHCIWCEKVGWYVMIGINGAARTEIESLGLKHCRAQLKCRQESSFSNPADKWETVLIFYGDAPSDNGSTVLLQLTVRGCDEEMCWEWFGPVPRVVRGGLSVLHK
ncbi:hypothetical protein LSM04_000742 [Trypanosoma melophagium]|uniref:uncharacterized protein n=1 Tax=Trypanosoma melophagium TaxID=715481 RepID=UPI00351A53D0|nr:hypothetical protein LSM04_000742 [Trypanosoma melophagium]